MVLVGHRAAVLDDVDAEFGGAGDGGVEGCMCRDRAFVFVRFVDDGFELRVGQLEIVVVRHDLDEVGAVHHLLAHRATHLVRARRFAAAPIGMAAGLGDGFAADEKARAGKDALLDGLLREVAALVHPQLAYRCRSRPQGREHVGGAFIGADLRRIVKGLMSKVVDAVPAKVRVRVDDAGEDRPRRFDHFVLVRTFGQACVGVGAYVLDDAVSNLDVTVFDDVVADASDHPSGEDGGQRVFDRELLEQRLKFPCGCFGHS